MIEAVDALGTVESSYDDFIQMVVPVSLLSTLAESPGIRQVRMPQKPVASIVSEGVAQINADVWQSANYTGAGVKVGILDGGFLGYTTRQSEGELPATVSTWWAPSIGGPGSSKHGTGIAEIVYDIAPNADFYLANFGTSVEMGNAVAWLITQGVDVISCSVAWPISGPGDGTGPINDIVDTARAAGILWSQSAGNFAEQHWQGDFTDSDANGLHDFNPGVDETNDITVTSGDTIVISLKWDDTWGESGNDYDLGLYDSGLNLVSSSENSQDGNDDPTESLSYTATYTGDYYIVLAKYGSPAVVNFHLYSFYHELEYPVTSGSLLVPADSPNAMAVGAVYYGTPTTIETFSSRGPTKDNRIKPDLVAPDGVSTVAYSPSAFFGTSASAPHAAGAAVLVKDQFPSYTPAQIQSFLENRAIDLGDAGKDNLFGSGRLYLGEVDGTPPTMEAITEAEGQYYNTTPILSNFGFDDAIALDDGWYQMDSYSGNWTALFTNVFVDNDVSDFAVAGDDTTIYTVDKERDKIYKSTNTGAIWTELTNPTGATEPQLVAVASDNSSIAAIVADGNEVYVTTNGGTNWANLGTVMESGEASATALYDIAISRATSGIYYVAVAGVEAGPLANIWYFDIGSVAPAWKETNDLAGFSATSVNSRAMAVAFSPNISSDLVMVAVTEEDDASSGTDYVKFEIFSLNVLMWNTSAGFPSYPVPIVNDDGITDIDSGSISMAPDYLGTDDALRVVFVGLTIAGDANATVTSGIYRLNDTTITALKTGTNIHSVAFNGTNLVAGAYDTANVHRSADPMAVTPVVNTTSVSDRPGGDNKVVVNWAGTKVVSGTSGSGSVFATSTDNGTTFNNISLNGTSWDSDNWTVPDFGILSEGSHIIYFKASDNVSNVEGETGEWDWQFFKDTVPPTDPAWVTSSSHTTGVWSSDNTVAITWTDATDSASGLDGYSILWDTSPGTIPDQIKDIEEGVQTTTSTPLAEGNSHYFHITSVDNAGNWQSTVHLGPFYIDTTAPADPTGVTSSSHTTSVWSNDNTVAITWTDATDNLSGLDGYSILWDTSATTIPDQIKDIEEGVQTANSTALADGNSHYFHISSVDNVGNWQSTVHLGPFFIDTNPPTMEAMAEAEGQYYNTAPVFSNFGFDDTAALDDGWYQIDSYSGNWTVLFFVPPSE